jgi:DNA helicase HerA-like ATPase
LKERAEYNLLLHLDELLSTTETAAAVKNLLSSANDDERAMAQRIQNLGLLNWSVWASGRTAVLDELRPFPRATVLDLSGFEYPREPLVASLALLDDLWAHREERQPLLLVIDEAHNICSNEPKDPLAVAATARLIQIANEGRKYGIWLLLCTQRPSRIHEGVLSQCDNLVLMRMNSRGDLAQLERTFGFAPAEMVAGAPYFRQGECLMAGGFVSAPRFVQVGQRRTQEGGSDVRVPLPAP